jgi:hypothetical protein
MRRRSQWIFWARRVEVERVVGRIIHRTTLAIVRGFNEAEWREERNWGRGTERDRRYRVQIGILI